MLKTIISSNLSKSVQFSSNKKESNRDIGCKIRSDKIDNKDVNLSNNTKNKFRSGFSYF